jgi:gamma-glutamyl-gamma-aminobutyrate hydrolase PuuD
MRKLIGITGPSTFTNEVIRMTEEFFEGNPVMLYMDHDENLDFWVSKLDAVFLCGGVDLHPMTYHRSFPAKRNMKQFDLKRDRREIKIIDRCLARQIPMLGICRGHQLLGVYRKDMLLLTDLCEDSMILHCPSIQEPKYQTDPYQPVHKVEIFSDRTFLGMKPTKEGFPDLWVNSFHHQGLLYQKGYEKDMNLVGHGYVTKDKSIIELMECPKEKWLSCQWHPEYDYKEQASSKMLLTYFKDRYLKTETAA